MFAKSPSGLDAIIQRPRPTPWQQFCANPCIFLAQFFYSARPNSTARLRDDAVTIVCISDTHNRQQELPAGDILIHAGDLTQSGTFKELQATIDWLNRQAHQHKIVIARNHELLLDQTCDLSAQAAIQRAQLDWGSCIYLENEMIEVTCSNGRPFKIYGSPYSPRQGNWAFQYPRSADLWKDSVPDNIDILITHCPPRGHLDTLKYGCEHLLRLLWHIRPRLHVFGHIHEGYGQEELHFDGLQRAFEETVLAGGGILNLCEVVKELVVTYLRPNKGAHCQLANAAMVGGHRDTEVRMPLIITI